MNGPSKGWLAARRAVLERVQLNVFDKMEPLYNIYIGVCLCYLVGFVRFKFFETGGEFSIVTSTHLLIVAFCGVLIPVLTGSVLVLHIASFKLQRLVGE